MLKGDGRNIMINQSLSCIKMVLTKKIGQARPGTTSIVKIVSVVVSHVIGISIVATA